MPPLRKVADVSIGGRSLALGKNGNYALVDESATDAWGRQIGVLLKPDEFCSPEAIQAILDVLGESIEKVRAMELERERRIGRGAE